ncbi:SH3 domain-containing protein [Pseudomonas sp. CDFA 610]|uniref:SH3 domain-containing protein n=1 Tax=Pseudomonas sp. CDFA 610 TaxID=2829825 RepID=UPI001E3D5C4B|nr:SH3 domain-containing protein [Pseudomonas sp. CDFA 610]MCD5984408.1 SH3 domain-containing protein [Pseudomonas sp. CDFA 610]
MRSKVVSSILALSIATSLSGCAQMGISKQQAGTMIGGLAGLAVGSAIGKGNGQIAAAVIAAGIGGYVGNRIGHMLDDRDQQALALRTQEVLNQPVTVSVPPPAVWRSDHSSATAQISQGREYAATRTVEVRRAPQVQAVPSMKLINAPYVTRSGVNVRAAPDMQADKVGGLPSNTEFTAVGSTGDWILVGRKGVTVGYVHKDCVLSKSEAVARRAASAANLDTMDVSASKETQAFDLDSIPSLPSEKVATETACKPVSVSLESASGSAEKQENTFCKQVNGTWELI